MNKSEFLEALKSKLQGLPEDDLQERLSFYEEAINDRMDEGMSEEEAVAELGSVDDVVTEIVGETSLVKLVKERIKPKRKIKAWEIVLLALGFPLWFPLCLTALILLLVAYLLVWVMVIVVYSVEISLAASSVAGLIGIFIYISQGQSPLLPLGIFIMCAGAAILLFFGCIYFTKITIVLLKKILLAIKAAFIKKGDK